MFKELETIAKEITEDLSLKIENSDYVGNVIREKLKEVREDSAHYMCECGTLINNNVFKMQSGKCPKCGERVQPIEESQLDEIYNEKRLTCPNCKTNEPYQRMVESSTCKVCGALMDVYTPYKKG